MRSLVADSVYFEFLDNLSGETTASTLAATLCLVGEFPNLRREEAKAIYLDWRKWSYAS